MNVGTKSVLFGAHAFYLHPFFIFRAWWKLYGFPWDPRLWLAFAIHDLGYWGKPNMDGPEGETHPEWAAKVMFKWCEVFKPHGIWSRGQGGLLFRDGEDPYTLPPQSKFQNRVARALNRVFGEYGPLYWHDFVLYHSRFYAKQDHRTPSRLCIADKLAICLTPAWLYLPMARATGEIHEYRKLGKDGASAQKYTSMNVWSPDEAEWYRNVQTYLMKWIEEHKDGKEDTWTPNTRVARDASGVWK